MHSAELEAVTGLSRFDLARQFRQTCGTSPYRYSLLRRLDAARNQLLAGTAPAVAAHACGFANQAHLTRHFRAALGQSPAHYASLFQGDRASTSQSEPLPRSDCSDNVSADF